MVQFQKNAGRARSRCKVNKTDPLVNILIVKTSAIGDVTHTLPALHALRAQYPDARITWLVEEAAADLIIGHRALDRVLVSRRKSWVRRLKKGPQRFAAFKEMVAFIRELRDTEYDLLIDFQGLLKSGLLVGLARARRKVGFGKGMEHAECSYIFLNERIPAVSMDIHAVDRELMLLKAIGIECREVVFDLPIGEEVRRAVADQLARHGVDAARPLVAVNPRATWPTKLWDNSKFAQLADQLLEQGWAVVFTGSSSDRAAIETIFSLMRNRAANLAGITTLKGLAALYERCRLVISTDTGPMHIAAAVDTPVIALFGPTAPWRTGPYGKKHAVVRLDKDCSPCFKKHCETIACMKEISVEQVLGAVNDMTSH